ncbi:two-component sensor [Vibrio maritimus]|uniref:Two-component sensor n=1 Tax=Vibrio maritimus TaxID=990268 RepID=A0A090T243_9VIBR|nr:two-component sensor [Vibrio maritimus]
MKWVNNGFTALSGYTLDETKGKKPGMLLQGPETDISTVRRLSRAIQDAQPIECELVNYHKNGTPYWIDISISLF